MINGLLHIKHHQTAFLFTFHRNLPLAGCFFSIDERKTVNNQETRLSSTPKVWTQPVEICCTAVSKKQDETHEPECRHVCWGTETILISHIFQRTHCETVDARRWHSSRTPLLDTIAQRSGKTLLLDTLTWHSCVTLLLDTVVRHSYLTLLLGTSYLTLLLDTLA